MFNIDLYRENMKKISFNLNLMQGFIKSAVRSIIKLFRELYDAF